MTVAYVDSSAIVKLILHEAESQSLTTAMAGFDDPVTSQIAVVEVTRAVHRTGLDPGFERIDAALDRISLVAVDADVVALARHLEPVHVRTLDAIHLASALSLGIDGITFIAYDGRLLDAARAAGMSVASPS